MAPSAEPNIGFMPYERPPELSKTEQLKLLLWDPEKKAVFGRDAKSWGGIIIFYLVFYAALAALFAVCIKGLLYSLDDNLPTWQQDNGLIGDNPGMGFRPLAEDVEKAGSMIVYVASDNKSVTSWTKRIDEVMEPYTRKSDNQVTCDFNKTIPPGKVCTVEPSSFGNCVHSNDYGFRNHSPCFFVKLNKIIGWNPKPYLDPSECPSDMPSELKNHIGSLPVEQRKVVWVTCQGENPADKENIGELQYWPYQGFATYFYPYKNTNNYMSPLVAVQLKRPVLNVLINIECRAWAHNIRYSKQKNEREGSVHLEVMVDE